MQSTPSPSPSPLKESNGTAQKIAQASSKSSSSGSPNEESSEPTTKPTTESSTEPIKAPPTHSPSLSSEILVSTPRSDNDVVHVIDSSSDEDATVAAAINNVALRSIQHRYHHSQIIVSQHSQTDDNDTHQENTPHSLTCPLLQCITNADVVPFLFVQFQDTQRLQVVLVLMSAFHQSVYNGITASAQQDAQHVHSAHVGDGEMIEATAPTEISGYFLCNQRYASSVFTCLCEVLHGHTVRLVTAQSCIYVMRYILSNRIYGDLLPYSVFQQLSVMYLYLYHSFLV